MYTQQAACLPYNHNSTTFCAASSNDFIERDYGGVPSAIFVCSAYANIDALK